MRASHSLIGLLFLMASLWAQGAELNLSPRFELHTNPLAEELDLAPLMGIRAGFGESTASGQFRLWSEGFAAYNPNEIRNNGQAQKRLYLEEAYLEGHFLEGRLISRIGLQALRWSQSWSLPSTDFWTGRRYENFFIDPLQEQWIHPIGLKLQYLPLAAHEHEIFIAIAQAQNTFPEVTVSQGFNQDPWQNKPAIGWRSKFSVKGLEISPVYAYKNQAHEYGLNLNYALENWVAKLEAGHRAEGVHFLTLGTDIFLGRWTFMPQSTVYSLKSANVRKRYPSVFVPVRWSLLPFEFEMQYLFQMPEQRQFLHFLSAYSFLEDKARLSLIAQIYRSSGGSTEIFEFFEQQSGSLLLGLRLEYFYSL